MIGETEDCRPRRTQMRIVVDDERPRDVIAPVGNVHLAAPVKQRLNGGGVVVYAVADESEFLACPMLLLILRFSSRR